MSWIGKFPDIGSDGVDGKGGRVSLGHRLYYTRLLKTPSIGWF